MVGPDSLRYTRITLYNGPGAIPAPGSGTLILRLCGGDRLQPR
jgi:hypothetical protein